MRYFSSLRTSLKSFDPLLHSLIQLETARQMKSIVLIPSENFTSKSVMETLGSPLQNKYSEGYPGQRYYGGNEYIDKVELLTQKRALEAFGLNPTEWGVNVQALSGSPANLYTYYATVGVGGRIMGLDLPHGGHLSHGYQTADKKISSISAYFSTMPYRLNEKTGYIDYDALEETSKLFRPKLIVAGASAYPREYDYERMRSISNNVGALLLSDMSHISGMVAAGVLKSPFEYSDLVTTTTHKSLRGPRGALIFYRRGKKGSDKKGNDVLYNLEQPINSSVFPGHQGGPHNHTIGALAAALHHAQQPEFRSYQEQVLKNNQALAQEMLKLGFHLVSGGSDTHLLLVDLRPKGIDGARVERVLELVNIACNKNTVPGDKSAMTPSGIRVGTPAMTTRGFKEADFVKVAHFLNKAVEITRQLPKSAKFKEFKEVLGDGSHVPQIHALEQEILDYLEKFPSLYDFE